MRDRVQFVNYGFGDLAVTNFHCGMSFFMRPRWADARRLSERVSEVRLHNVVGRALNEEEGKERKPETWAMEATRSCLQVLSALESRPFLLSCGPVHRSWPAERDRRVG